MAEEDWNPPEAFIEDRLAEQPHFLLRHADIKSDDKVKCRRQFRIDGVGIADLVIFSRGRISVVEIKRNVIDEGAVAQCLRYMGAFQSPIDTLGCSHQTPLVEGILCAPNITHGACYAMYGSGADIHFYRCRPSVDIAFMDASPYSRDENLLSEIAEAMHNITIDDAGEQPPDAA